MKIYLNLKKHIKKKIFFFVNIIKIAAINNKANIHAKLLNCHANLSLFSRNRFGTMAIARSKMAIGGRIFFIKISFIPQKYEKQATRKPFT